MKSPQLNFFFLFLHCRFGDGYAVHLQETEWQTSSGNKSTYHACYISRQKTEESLKKSRSKDTFYSFDFPARRLPSFINGVRFLMQVNDLEPIPNSGAETDSDSGHQPIKPTKEKKEKKEKKGEERRRRKVSKEEDEQEEVSNTDVDYAKEAAFIPSAQEMILSSDHSSSSSGSDTTASEEILIPKKRKRSTRKRRRRSVIRDTDDESDDESEEEERRRRKRRKNKKHSKKSKDE